MTGCEKVEAQNETEIGKENLEKGQINIWSMVRE